VVVGGVGSRFDDQKTGESWHRANQQITGYLYDILEHEGFKVTSLVVPPNETSEGVKTLVTEALARNRCNRIIQIAHFVNEDDKGPYFLFNVSIQHIELDRSRPTGSSGTSVVSVGDYSRDYRYPLTPASLDALFTGMFANSAYLDLKNSGALEPLQRSRGSVAFLSLAEISAFPQLTCAPDADSRTEVRARHIAVAAFTRDTLAGKKATPEELRSAYRKLEVARRALLGGESFETVWAKYSDSSTSDGSSGGDLGFFKRNVMVPEFDKVAFCLSVGEVSPVVRTVFGFHLIQVTGVRN